ncbi:MAG TPA: hypothetical protein IAC14_06665 [Candidatus Scybalomonas excrementigallinarum]|nr:hypothetical protein [Candidatus Scybalomonas excrementigallinarum]
MQDKEDTFGNLDVGNSLSLTVKNGDIKGMVIGSYDDFIIQSDIKKGDSNLPDNKNGGEKTLNVSSNNGDVNIDFVIKKNAVMKTRERNHEED